MSDTVIETISKTRIIPVVTVENAAEMPPLATALIEGGIPIAEITLRTSSALSALQSVASRGDLLVGAGTVLTAEQCREAIFAGAKFIVSPGFDHEVVEVCQERAVPCFPGVATATEVQRASKLGLNVVKFFPAEPLGGTKMLQALSAPFSNLKFVPTGGIGPANLQDYLSLNCVLAVGGSWMVKRSLFVDGDFSKVAELARQAVDRIA